MKFKHLFLLGLMAALASACSNLNAPMDEESEASNKPVSISSQNWRVVSDAPTLRNATSVRIGRYVDARMSNPRKVGTTAVNAFGMSGKDVILEQDAADMVISAMKKRLLETGFNVIEQSDASAQFELSGVVKDLLYSVKARDEVSIVIESTLRNVSTGRVLWSAIVEEKNDHFSGVPRTSVEEVTTFLIAELDVIATKTVASITDSLLISHPELFSFDTTVRSIPGVTVMVAPVAPHAMNDVAPSVVMPMAVYEPSPKATTGMLIIRTLPAKAKVYIDGVYQGLTPFRGETEAGLYTLSIKLEGYQMITEKVSIRKKNITEMDLALVR